MNSGGMKREREVIFPTLGEVAEEDKDFLLVLFTETAQQNEELKEKIAASLSNWKLERVALTDQIILEMALIEIIHFPYIFTVLRNLKRNISIMYWITVIELLKKKGKYCKYE